MLKRTNIQYSKIAASALLLVFSLSINLKAETLCKTQVQAPITGFTIAPYSQFPGFVRTAGNGRALYQHEGNVYVVDVVKAERGANLDLPTELLPGNSRPTRQRISSASLQPEGTSVLVSTDSEYLLFNGITGEKIKTLGKRHLGGKNYFQVGPVWSPKGRYIAFPSNYNLALKIYDTKSGITQTIRQNWIQKINAIAWHEDEGMIAFLSGQLRAYVHNMTNNPYGPMALKAPGFLNPLYSVKWIGNTVQLVTQINGISYHFALSYEPKLLGSSGAGHEPQFPKGVPVTELPALKNPLNDDSRYTLVGDRLAIFEKGLAVVDVKTNQHLLTLTPPPNALITSPGPLPIVAGYAFDGKRLYVIFSRGLIEAYDIHE